LQSLPITIGNLQNLTWLNVVATPLSDVTKQFLQQLRERRGNITISKDF